MSRKAISFLSHSPMKCVARFASLYCVRVLILIGFGPTLIGVPGLSLTQALQTIQLLPPLRSCFRQQQTHYHCLLNDRPAARYQHPCRTHHPHSSVTILSTFLLSLVSYDIPLHHRSVVAELRQFNFIQPFVTGHVVTRYVITQYNISNRRFVRIQI